MNSRRRKPRGNGPGVSKRGWVGPRTEGPFPRGFRQQGSPWGWLRLDACEALEGYCGFLAATLRLQAWLGVVRALGCAIAVGLAGCVVHLGDSQLAGGSGGSPARSGDCAPKPSLSRTQVACLIEDEGVNQLGAGGAFNRAIGVRSMQDVVRHFGCLAEHESGRGRLACGIGGEGLLGINRMHLKTDLPGCANSLGELRRDHRANIRCAFGLYAAQNGFWHWGRPRGSGYSATDWGTNKACPSAKRATFPLCP